MTAPVPDHASLPVEQLRVTAPSAPTWHIYANETEWFSAVSPEHAQQRCREFYNEGEDGEMSAGPWEQWPDEKILTVRDDDTGQRHVFPCSWWANDPDSRRYGFVCSTEA